MRYNKLICLLLLLLINTGLIIAQQGYIKGLLTDKSSGHPIAGAVITDASGNELGTTSDDGLFLVPAVTGRQMLFFNMPDYEQMLVSATVTEGAVYDAGTLEMMQTAGFMMDLSSASIIEGFSEDGFETQTIQGVLSSSADIFLSTAAYTFGPVMYRLRGYDNNYQNVSL
ncbi:MAG: hypothetical protein E4G92_03845, partial [Bacteroidia bacterium]